MATLASSERHSIGDLTLYLLKFSTVTSTDSYAITNLPGAIGIWGIPYAGVNTLTTFSATYSNSGTGVTLTMYSAINCTASVYVLGHG